jgi:hypothetical protein
MKRKIIETKLLILYFCGILWTQYFKSCFSRKELFRLYANIVLIAILPVLYDDDDDLIQQLCGVSMRVMI